MAESQRISAPVSSQPLVVAGQQNTMDHVWYRWAVAVSGRRAANVATLSGAKTNDELRDAINEITAALRAADLMGA